jgi:hypothetical protein
MRLPVAAVMLVVSALAHAAEPVPFPDGYRNWTHVKSMVIPESGHPLSNAFGGIHHVYVDDAGVAALKVGKGYPDGTVLVFDLLAVEPADGGASVEGERKFVAVMMKDSDRFAATGGWGFEAFAEGQPSKPTVKDADSECFACHQTKQSRDYVYSEWRP